jgi:hypothetical protein
VPLSCPRFKATPDKVKDRDDARFLARAAFGTGSLRVTAMKLSKHPVLGSMADDEFMVSNVSQRR